MTYGQRTNGVRHAQARTCYSSAGSTKCIGDSCRDSWGISSYLVDGQRIAGGIKGRPVRSRRSHHGRAPKKNGGDGGKGRANRRYPTPRGLRGQRRRFAKLQIKLMARSVADQTMRFASRNNRRVEFPTISRVGAGAASFFQSWRHVLALRASPGNSA